MTEADDEDVDSGWEMGEQPAPSVSAPASSAEQELPPPKVEPVTVAKASTSARAAAPAQSGGLKPGAPPKDDGAKKEAVAAKLAPPKAPPSSPGAKGPAPATKLARPVLGASAIGAKAAPKLGLGSTKPLSAAKPPAGALKAPASAGSPPSTSEVPKSARSASEDSFDLPDDGAEVDLAKTTEAPAATESLQAKLRELSKRVDAAMLLDDDEPPAVTVRVDVPQVPATLAERLAARGEREIPEDRSTPPGGVELASLASLAVDDEEGAPTTRRATDDELVQMKRRANVVPALRLSGRRSTTPVRTEAVNKAKQLDARLHTRPTPPARPPLTPTPPAATTAIRLGSESPTLARTRATAATKVNFQAVRLDDVSRDATGGAGKGRAEAPSDPALDLHLPEDLGSPPAAPVQPKTGDAFDDLPFDEMIESARPSTRPPPPSAPKPAPKAEAPAQKFAVKAPAALAGSRREKPTAPAIPSAKALEAASRSSKPVQPASPFDVVDDPSEDLVLSTTEAELSVEEMAALGDDLNLDGLDAFGDAAPAGASPFELDEPGAASRVAPEPVAEEDEDPAVTGIRLRFEKGDYFGAMLRAESALEADPGNEAARRYLDSARDLVAQMYKEKLGSGDQVLRLAMAPNEIQGLTLDHRSGFLISLVDGVATVDEILDMSGMPEIDVLRLLYEMREQGVVSVDSMAPT